MTELLDPFSQLYNALWTMVERNRELKKLIPEGNRIRYQHESELKEQPNFADRPELQLLSGGGSFGGRDNNTSRSVTKEFVWGITTADFRVNQLFNKVSWELFRSMSDWECVLCNLSWCNCRFVQNFRLISAEDSLLMTQLDKGLDGWSSLWQVEVDCGFLIRDLKLKE